MDFLFRLFPLNYINVSRLCSGVLRILSNEFFVTVTPCCVTVSVVPALLGVGDERLKVVLWELLWGLATR